MYSPLFFALKLQEQLKIHYLSDRYNAFLCHAKGVFCTENLTKFIHSFLLPTVLFSFKF
ncbi:Uncharacterised protein [Legionella bozemanae]|uniref:Uncharacterized protein n=1 Tax=Legionella bozemanae TaxID=447 RepID=A0A0W0RDU5_LEGBO|nr:hypothetical protein Lboz_3331 [Legionella bozemanae]STO32920.1 Uncharacterised protein [Legionella bozemanae]